MIQTRLKQLVASAIQEAFSKTEARDFSLDVPADPSCGDYSTNAAIQIKQGNPQETAEKIIAKIKKPDFIDSVKTKNGFINFYLSRGYLTENLQAILKQGDRYGQSEIGNGKTVVIDYSAPNIAKPFSVGHLRSTIIGQAVYNFYKFIGYNTIGDNHLGDWGTQYGKLLYGISEWGKLEKIAANPIPELLKLYIKFHQEAEKNPLLNKEGQKWFSRLEQGDEEAKILWQQCVDWSMEYFDKLYAILDIKIDYAHGESFYSDKTASVIKELEQKGILKESEGAKTVFFPQDKLPPAIIVKSDGATNYMTRDLAAVKYRLDNWHADRIIYHVGSDQSLYFKQLIEIVRMLGWSPKVELVCAEHGLARFSDGKMSTRKGKVIFLEDLIEEAKKRVKKLMGTESPTLVSDDLIQTIAIGAIKYNDLSYNRRKDVIFDWNKILNLEGNSGPYLQYTYARIMGLFREIAKKNIPVETEKFPSLRQKKDDIRPLLRHLSYFSETIIKAAETQMPHFLCEYLYQLASLYNGYYNNNRIIVNNDEEGTGFRLSLSSAVAQVLKNGLGLLGIKTSERM